MERTAELGPVWALVKTVTLWISQTSYLKVLCLNVWHTKFVSESYSALCWIGLRVHFWGQNDGNEMLRVIYFLLVYLRNSRENFFISCLSKRETLTSNKYFKIQQTIMCWVWGTTPCPHQKIKRVFCLVLDFLNLCNFVHVRRFTTARSWALPVNVLYAMCLLSYS